jgi:hypothetical protein
MTRSGFIAAALASLGAVALWQGWRAKPLSDADFAARYALPLPPPAGPLRTYHLGHSLVGRDMPVMLAQLAGHDHASQLGWGASLRQHWNRDVPGFVAENAHAFYRAASEAVNYGNYDAIIFTEMVELRDAIRWHDSANALANWAAMARVATPGVRLYLYETWHRLDDPAGWLHRIDTDLAALWQGEILRPAMARPGTGTIHIIPGGQVMAAAVRAIEGGHVPGLTLRAALFAKGADGTTDPIHLNDLGNYLMALTHFAVLYHRNPVGLPHDVLRADGTRMAPIGRKTAQILQEVVWRTIARYPQTGVAKGL